MSERTSQVDAALRRALDWLAALQEPPGLDARASRGAAAPEVDCGALPYAVAHVAAAWHRASPVRAAPPAVEEWLAGCCDADGWVRFYGPDAPEVIGPDVDDTALVWSQRRALGGEEPPPGVLAGVLACRGPAGAFATWPDPPADGPRVEVDPVVNANVLALLGALGRRDTTAEAVVHAALTNAWQGRPIGGHWYPDAAALWLAARRAARLGGVAKLNEPSTPVPGASLLMQLARSRDDDVEAVLTAQDDDGAWPWAGAFIGGDHNVFPGGEVMSRPWFGGRALTTALAVERLADVAGWPAARLPPSRGAVAAAARHAPGWTHAAGRLADGVTLVRRDIAGLPQPVLLSRDGELRLELAPNRPDGRHYAAAGAWAVSYRGDRRPTPAEHDAIEALLERLADLGHDPGQVRDIALRGAFRCARQDAADVPAWLAAARLEPGAEVTVALPDSLTLSDAVPALASALDQAEVSGVSLRLANLPRCTLPWPDGRLTEARPARELDERTACGRCVDHGRCTGPVAGLAPRPVPRSAPWVSLRRFAEEWTGRARHGSAGPEWSVLVEGLEDLPAGTLADATWSVTVAADVVGGTLDPTLRVAAFYGPAPGSEAARLPGRRVLERLAARGWDRIDAPLAPHADELPVYPAFAEGGGRDGRSLYLDTSSLDPGDAWEIAGSVGRATGHPISTPNGPLPALLGVSVARSTATGELAYDVYVRWRRGTSSPWSPPAEALELAGPGPLHGTLRAGPHGRLDARKWDMPWWSTGGTDAALLEVLGVEGDDATQLAGLLTSERFTLHPTTLAWRAAGRRVYMRIR